MIDSCIFVLLYIFWLGFSSDEMLFYLFIYSFIGILSIKQEIPSMYSLKIYADLGAFKLFSFYFFFRNIVNLFLNLLNNIWVLPIVTGNFRYLYYECILSHLIYLLLMKSYMDNPMSLRNIKQGPESTNPGLDSKRSSLSVIPPPDTYPELCRAM